MLKKVPIGSSRVTQVLLAALVLTQIPNLFSFVDGLNRFDSEEAASRACQQWAALGDVYTVKRSWPWTRFDQYPTRSCEKETDRFSGLEIPLDTATALSSRPGDPIGFDVSSVPVAEDTGQSFRFKRRRWSLTIPF